ncbi:MAG: carbamoyltransferase HypF, partial [Candidatus Margulisiibacteriota bacterium]
LDDTLMLDPAPIIKGIVEDIKAMVPNEAISYKFHNTIAKATGKICKAISKETKIKKVCLSGGVFQNNLLLESILRELKKMRLEAFINEKVPTNDGGISLGQVRFAKDVFSNSGQG